MRNQPVSGESEPVAMRKLSELKQSFKRAHTTSPHDRHSYAGFSNGKVFVPIFSTSLRLTRGDVAMGLVSCPPRWSARCNRTPFVRRGGTLSPARNQFPSDFRLRKTRIRSRLHAQAMPYQAPREHVIKGNPVHSVHAAGASGRMQRTQHARGILIQA